MRVPSGVECSQMSASLLADQYEVLFGRYVSDETYLLFNGCLCAAWLESLSFRPHCVDCVHYQPPWLHHL